MNDWKKQLEGMQAEQLLELAGTLVFHLQHRLRVFKATSAQPQEAAVSSSTYKHGLGGRSFTDAQFRGVNRELKEFVRVVVRQELSKLEDNK